MDPGAADPAVASEADSGAVVPAAAASGVGLGVVASGVGLGVVDPAVAASGVDPGAVREGHRNPLPAPNSAWNYYWLRNLNKFLNGIRSSSSETHLPHTDSLLALDGHSG